MVNWRNTPGIPREQHMPAVLVTLTRQRFPAPDHPHREPWCLLAGPCNARTRGVPDRTRPPRTNEADGDNVKHSEVCVAEVKTTRTPRDWDES
jgi:hypothetical protein